MEMNSEESIIIAFRLMEPLRSKTWFNDGILEPVITEW
jgi:hypothetical protein